MGISEVVDQKAKMLPPTPPTLYWRLLARVKQVLQESRQSIQSSETRTPACHTQKTQARGIKG